jgi:nucleoside-diphosphate-sugar epimerase
MPTLVNKTIAMTGPTGIVGAPLVADLARENKVIALARFSDDAARTELEGRGVECHKIDFTNPDFSAVPAEVDVVLNLSVAKTGVWRQDLAANAEGAGKLMSHFRGAGAFFHCSTGAVYAPNGGQPFATDDPHGNHHEHMLPTYSISKIATESVVRFSAAEFQLPTVIARLNVPYSDHNGWPWFHLQMMRAGMDIEVHPDGANYNLLHADDITADVPVLLDQASVDTTVVNWASPGVVSIEEWCGYITELGGAPAANIVESEKAIPSTVMNVDHLSEIRPERLTDWRSGIRRIVEANPA